MPSFRVGVVSEIVGARSGLQRVLVDLGSVVDEQAYVLTQLTGAVAVGDRVVVNTTAVELGLGTGGWHIVHWNLAREAWTGATAGATPAAGMKLRYTSLQVDVENAEPAGETDVGGMPVVAAGLHSQVAAIAAAFKQVRPRARLVYVMTDGGALPIAISELVWQLRERELIDATVTCGHAFGGDHEAVSVHGALAVARHVAGADATVVAMGPGSAGTASRLGFSGIEVGPVLDAATALHGVPIAALRVSFADARPRHYGVSHHSTTVLSLATRSRVRVPVPCVGGEEERRIRSDLTAARVDERHEVVDVAPVGAVQLLVGHGLHVESMGRAASEDPVLFEAAAAAGVLAARTVT
jgi:hypothetical protein